MKENELSCKDIMVGDWVSYHGIATKVAPADFCQKKWLEEIKPIPLTPEILEKNDFKYRDSYGYSFINRKELCGDGFEDEKVYINTALNTLIIYTATGNIHLPVKYIHQLQHALRLCEIEKEIIL